MSEETNILFQEYSKNPINNFALQKYTIKQSEGNFICGDDITVYLVINKKNIIENFSFDGNCSTITTAAASYLSDFIKGTDIKDVLTWTYQTMLDRWFEVSPRRKRAAVIAILATRNAIHIYTKDDKKDTFEDLIDD